MQFRTLLGIGLGGGLSVLAGCGASETIIGDSGSGSDGSFAKPVDSFDGWSAWSAPEDSASFKSSAVEIPSDLLAEAPDSVHVVVGAGLGGGSDAAANKLDADGPFTNGHAVAVFHFSENATGACDSEVVVGPFELSVEDGTVTFTSTALPLDGAALAIAHSGRFHLCAETWSALEGGTPLGAVSVAFGEPIPEDEQVEICHVPSGNADDRHTILVGAAAVATHLGHGDTLGPCSETGTADSDLDGVPDDQDECPDTPPDHEVYANGCSVVVLEVDAGPDATVFAGDPASASGTVTVVQGSVDEAQLVYTWEQVGGSLVGFSSESTTLHVETAGMDGDLTFRLTVATADGTATDSDEVVVSVVPLQITALASGKWHNVALWNNDEVSLWGWNRYGQLGDGSTMDDVAAVAAGLKHTVLAKKDGTVWTFGENALTASASPVQVPGVEGVVQVAALAVGALMVDGGGTVWGFSDGFDNYCDLGGAMSVAADGSVTPVPVPGLPADVVSVSAGARHGLALDANGTAWVWGSRFGCTPWAVLDDVVEVAAGATDLCLFRRSDGTVWSMGFNLHGQLGDGTQISKYRAPSQVQGVSNIVALAAGERHSAFLAGDGTLYVAGWNRYCQLGLEDAVTPTEPVYGTDVVLATPVGVVGFSMVASGYTHSLAVGGDNSVWGWGLNSVGQVSGGTLTTLPFTVCTPTPLAFPEE